MGQIGFFDLSNRYTGLDRFGDPLVLLKKSIPWEAFRPELRALWRKPDKRHKLIRDYEVSDASVHDSRMLDDLIDANNTSSDFWGDSAYRSADAESRLEDKGYHSHIHHKGKRNKPLTARQMKANKTRSKVRVRVEHVFGFQERSMGAKFIRTIGMARAKTKIGMMNLVYNMNRLVQFKRGVAVPG